MLHMTIFKIKSLKPFTQILTVFKQFISFLKFSSLLSKRVFRLGPFRNTTFQIYVSKCFRLRKSKIKEGWYVICGKNGLDYFFISLVDE